VSYYFAGGFGLKLRADMNFKQTLETTRSEYVLTWTQGIPPFGPNEKAESWDVAGDMSLTTFSLDLVYKFDRTGMFQPYLNAGMSLFTGTANLSTTQGFGMTWANAGTPYIDYFDVPLKIQDASLGSLGFNAGLGADIYFTPNIGLNLDAVYFLGKTFDLVWTPIPGNYAANLNPGWTVDATADGLRRISDSLGPLKLSTSFFKVMLGLKVGF
jgi:opacity protein-like surface antigen